MPTMLSIITFLTRASVICLLFGYIGRMVHLRLRSRRQFLQDKISQKNELLSWQTFLWFCLFFCVVSIVLTLDFDYDAKPQDAIVVTALLTGVIGFLGTAVITIFDLKKKDPNAHVYISGTFWFWALLGLASLAVLIWQLLILKDYRVWTLVLISVAFGAAFGLVFKRPFKPKVSSGFDWVVRFGLCLLALLVLLTAYLTVKSLFH